MYFSSSYFRDFLSSLLITLEKLTDLVISLEGNCHFGSNLQIIKQIWEGDLSDHIDTPTRDGYEIMTI